MPSVADIKPRFANDDIYPMLSSLYFTFCQMNPNRHDLNYRAGFIAGLAAFALQVGLNPTSFLSENDLNLLRKAQSR